MVSGNSSRIVLGELSRSKGLRAGNAYFVALDVQHDEQERRQVPVSELEL